MDPDTAGRIFERFYRGDASRTPGGGGTGLGLSIVKSIAEAHGGTVTVRTTPEEGSTFTVTLPACAPRGPASACQAPGGRREFDERV
ncbi:sensor histidine kinase [Streptomyces sioyaensis]|uniref:sensor histidine kinase n=1 Tax=Streptomyces sioyaensis TaxID=67364 RepID=UPI0033E6E052